MGTVFSRSTLKGPVKNRLPLGRIIADRSFCTDCSYQLPGGRLSKTELLQLFLFFLFVVFDTVRFFLVSFFLLGKFGAWRVADSYD